MKLIKLGFEISLPIDRYDHIYEKTWATPFKNKYVQVSCYQRNSLISFYMDFSIKEDHAGFMLEFDFLGFGASICLYDCRHWNYENNCWEDTSQTGTRALHRCPFLLYNDFMKQSSYD